MSPRPNDVPADARRDRGSARTRGGAADSYFAGELTEFDLPLAPRGSEFQLRVWNALLEIPYGETASYGEIANGGRSDPTRCGPSAQPTAATRSR